jgi:hypothetical protein
MEYLADLLDLADGTDQHGGANAPDGKVGTSSHGGGIIYR